MAFELTCSEFKEGELIPSKYTCSGQDISPPLQWTQPPKGTRSLALIMDDPDAPAGTWVHWVIFNLPADQGGLPERVPPKESFPKGVRQGVNDFKGIGYGGPCPPPGKPHRYYFKLYALNIILGLSSGSTKTQVLEACKNHILGEAQLMGRFGR